MTTVTVKKISVALEPEVAKAAAAAAAREGTSLSAWMNRAAEHELKIDEGLAGVRWYEEHYGAFTEAERAETRRELDRALRRARRNAASS